MLDLGILALSPGTQLGRYEILAPLGAGGMGEVYRARDTRLGREVALKVLPEEVAQDRSRLQRFEQEARTVAALNHPNIVGLFDVGERYLVTELVDGETLRGNVGVARALDITGQIAGVRARGCAKPFAHDRPDLHHGHRRRWQRPDRSD